VPYTAFKNAGFDVKFATEAGKSPQCDSKMLEGLTQRILVRSLPIRAYRASSNMDE
jgi:putative intracellular protease/amidase